MFDKLEHLGIAVKNIAESDKLFKKLLGDTFYKQEEVESEGVKTAFYDGGNTKLELLEATTEGSPIKKFIDKKGEGLHHIAFEVDDIYKRMEELKNDGFRLLNETPKAGADNKLICFIHPKDTNGILIELCMDKSKLKKEEVADKLQNPFGLHTITPYLIVKDAEKLIKFLQDLFQAELRGEIHYREDKRIKHAELKIGDSVIMLGTTMENIGQANAGFYIYVENCDASYKKALELGAESIMEPVDFPHGDRYGGVKDFEGNTWWVVEHVGKKS